MNPDSLLRRKCNNIASISVVVSLATLICDQEHPPQGARLFFERGSARGVPAQYAEKIGDILALLNRGPLPDALNLPGLTLHPLTGDRRGTWSAWVTHNYRVTFEIEGQDAINVDYEDYHGK